MVSKARPKCVRNHSFSTNLGKKPLNSMPATPQTEGVRIASAANHVGTALMSSDQLQVHDL